MTLAAQAITGSSAMLVAEVKPRGRATRYWFQYGTSPGYRERTPTRSAGSGNQALLVSAAITSLSPLARYHYRVVASDCHDCAHGTAHGRGLAFTVGGYENPVFGNAEAADPFVLDVAGLHVDYWAFTTGNLFPLLHSTDLVHWTSSGTAMAARPSWAVQSGDWHPWAPNVVNAPGACPGSASKFCYLMYYVALSARTGANCVAVATAASPGGPYTDQGPLTNGVLDASGRPVGCGDNRGYGVIDPSLFADPRTGAHYLYASEDFACRPDSTSCTQANSTLKPTISVIPLSSDLRHASGPRIPLFSGSPNSWESAGVAAPTVEGPTVLAHKGLYYMLYSGGGWRQAYGMGYAVALSPVGPFVKSPANPMLAQNSAALSPGGADTPVVGPRGGTWVLYHGRAGNYANPRTLRIAPLTWQPTSWHADIPVIGAPTATPQPGEP